MLILNTVYQSDITDLRYLNTSYVDIKHYNELILGNAYVHLNTSYVDIKHINLQTYVI